ncbi:unnamed protein product [Linum tenue]|uniref:Uncharacterized protein n=1 Tax=Linum tenue TaxID=586396 RepID=A0AAV0QWG0_9ROSI|nr:unnamed protein product [Linum tenue]
MQASSLPVHGLDMRCTAKWLKCTAVQPPGLPVHSPNSSPFVRSASNRPQTRS